MMTCRSIRQVLDSTQTTTQKIFQLAFDVGENHICILWEAEIHRRQYPIAPTGGFRSHHHGRHH